MPNFPANLLALYHGRSFDPDTNLAAPLQSGMTGLMIDKKKTGPQDVAGGPVQRRSSRAR